jgi:hypothetical protein
LSGGNGDFVEEVEDFSISEVYKAFGLKRAQERELRKCGYCQGHGKISIMEVPAVCVVCGGSGFA